MRDRRPDPTFGEGAVLAAGVEGHLRHLLAVARLVAEGIVATGGAEVIDRNDYAFVVHKIPEILEFRGFSLAELTYRLQGGERPGARLWLEQGPTGPRVEIVVFEDVEQWRVSERGEKISATLLTLELDGPEIKAVAGLPPRHPASGGQQRWHELLVEALCAPLILFARE